MSKLTLSIDDRVVSSAKRYAKQRGVSVSQMVSGAVPDAPILRSLRGSLKKADPAEYRRHLAATYR